MHGSAWRRALLLRICYVSAVAALFTPLALVAAMSVTTRDVVAFPITGITARWYAAALSDPEIVRAFALSVSIAFASTAVALVVGTWISLALAALRGPLWRAVLFAAACSPLVMPGIVAAIALRMFIRVVGLDPGAAAVAFGHAIHAVPFVVVVVGSRLRRMPPDLHEAARDLGADSSRIFLFVTLPYLRPALIGAGMLAVLLSFDDFLRAFFLGGWQPTLPVLLYGRLQSGLSPEIDAVATIVLVLAGLLGAVGEWQIRRYARV